MVATIAHEIRNPLGTVRSSAEVLAEEDKSGPIQDSETLADRIVEEATVFSSILTDFLDFAKSLTES